MLRRWNSHIYDALKRGRGRSHFHNAIRRYGKDAFSHEVLEVCYSLEAANAAEERWIENLGARDPSRGFNLTPGGKYQPNPARRNPWKDPNYGWHDTDLRKRHGRKMRAIVNQPAVKAKIREKVIAFVRSPEWRERARALQTGRTESEETRDKIAGSLSATLRKVPNHVSCSRHGLVPFSECTVVKPSGRRRPHYRCKLCKNEREREKRRRAREITTSARP